MGCLGAWGHQKHLELWAISPSDSSSEHVPVLGPPRAAQLLQIGIVFLVLALSPLGFLGLKDVKLLLFQRTGHARRTYTIWKWQFQHSFLFKDYITVHSLVQTSLCTSCQHLFGKNYHKGLCETKKGAPDHPLYGVGRNMLDRYKGHALNTIERPWGRGN